jgi:hypothetical protein
MTYLNFYLCEGLAESKCTELEAERKKERLFLPGNTSIATITPQASLCT